jgi:hypothetical protein
VKQPIVLNRGLISKLTPIYVPVNSLPTFSSPGIYGQFFSPVQGAISPPKFIQLSDFIYQSSSPTPNNGDKTEKGKATEHIVVSMPGSAAVNELMTDSTQNVRFPKIDIYTAETGPNSTIIDEQKFEMRNAFISNFTQSTTSNGTINVTFTIDAQNVDVTYPSN